MANEFEKLICKTLEENPGAELRFTRRDRSADAATINMDIKSGSKWLQSPMSEQRAREGMLGPLEGLRRGLQAHQLAAAAPKPPYVPTPDEQAELATRVVFSCKSCANTGVGVGGSRCPCMRRTKVASDG